MAKRDKSELRYADYYWCMSLADFQTWISSDGDTFEFTLDAN